MTGSALLALEALTENATLKRGDNEWVDKNNFGIKYTEFELQNIACSENVKFSTTLKTQSQLKLN